MWTSTSRSVAEPLRPQTKSPVWPRGGRRACVRSPEKNTAWKRIRTLVERMGTHVRSACVRRGLCAWGVGMSGERMCRGWAPGGGSVKGRLAGVVGSGARAFAGKNPQHGDASERMVNARARQRGSGCTAGKPSRSIITNHRSYSNSVPRFGRRPRPAGGSGQGSLETLVED